MELVYRFSAGWFWTYNDDILWFNYVNARGRAGIRSTGAGGEDLGCAALDKNLVGGEMEVKDRRGER